MVIGALVIGAITAYYFGLKVGGFAAAVAAGLFLLAVVMPSKALPIYGLVGAGFLGVLVIGPRRAKAEGKGDLLKWGRRAFSSVFKFFRRKR